MKKLILLFSVFSAFLLNNCNAQSWNSLGTGVNGHVNHMVVYNGKLYVAGTFTKAGPVTVNHIACWNGTSWSALGSWANINANLTYINTMCVYNNKLYVGGDFDSAGTVYAKNIASWDGANWAPVGLGLSTYGVGAMCVYNNNLVVAGGFDSAGGQPASGLAMYNGTGWSSFGSQGAHGINDYISSMVVYNGKLYAGGAFDSIGNIAARAIAAWDGVTWTNLGNGVRSSNCYCNGYVSSMDVFYGNLYVAGTFDTVGNNIVAKAGAGIWNGSQWNAPPSPGNYSLANFAATVWGTSWYIGGFAPNIYQWTGSRWDSIGNPIFGDTGVIYAMTVYNGALYAGGQFTNIGGISAKSIAKCYGPLAVNEVKDESANVSVFPNPSSNGVFTIQSSVVSGQSSVEVYNMLGEKIYSQTFSTQHSILNLGSQPAGVYMYRVITQTGNLVGSGKLIIQ